MLLNLLFWSLIVVNILLFSFVGIGKLILLIEDYNYTKLVLKQEKQYFKLYIVRD